MTRTLRALPTALLLFLISCKKETTYTFTDLNFRIHEVVNDSTIRLAWDALPQKDVKEYRLIRSMKRFGKYSLPEDHKDTFSIRNVGAVSAYLDALPLSGNVTYRLEASAGPTLLKSKEIVHERRQGLHFGLVDYTLFDAKRKYAYTVDKEYGHISQFNYEKNEFIKRITLSYNLGFCSLAEFDGKSELFVPRSDGWVEIYDATSLVLKDRLYVGGQRVASVIYQNGLLFVATTDNTLINGVIRPVKVYSRNGKNLVSRLGKYINSRLLSIPGTITELYDVSNSPHQLLHYKFDDAGNLLSEREVAPGDYQTKQPELSMVSPDGKTIVVNSGGAIYDTNLSIIRLLARTERTFYNGFAFNATGNKVYCALQYRSEIEVLQSGGQLLHKIQTRLYPWGGILVDGNKLIVVSTDFPNHPGTVGGSYFFFEQFNL